VRFFGAVLVGGSGTRMGRDKATLEVAGRPLATVAARALRDAGALEVALVGGDRATRAGLGAATLPDAWPGTGPLGGIVGALGWAGRGIVVVLACDLPFASPDAVRAVVGALAAEPRCSVAVAVLDGRREYLHAAWRADAAPVLADALVRGERAVRRAAAPLGTREVHDLERAWLTDADRPEDLPG
jgi:molybdopterin-guanine dinucleotide biosynthesis protein A